MISIHSLMLLFCIATAIGLISGRYLDKDASNGYPSKLFDYYDVAKGNIPTYLTEVDKPLEPRYEEDSEPVKINEPVDNNNVDSMMRQEHAIEVQPSENRPENLEGYDEYAAEDNVNKPLETPGIIIDGETKSKNNNNEDDNVPIPLASSTTTTISTISINPKSNETEKEIISNVDEDIMILRTIKPLCQIDAESRIARDCEN